MVKKGTRALASKVSTYAKWITVETRFLFELLLPSVHYALPRYKTPKNNCALQSS